MRETGQRQRVGIDLFERLPGSPAWAGITFSHAIRNADSWGYFCVDLAGMLAEADRTKVLGKGALLKAA